MAAAALAPSFPEDPSARDSSTRAVPAPPTMPSDPAPRAAIPATVPPPVDFDAIPAELRALRQWVPWKFVPNPKKPKPDKVPMGVNGYACSITDPRNFLTFDVARAALEPGGFSGLGFCFTASDDFVGVDLDKVVLPDGTLTPEAREIVEALGSYTEVTPSKTGLHVISRGKLSAKGHKKQLRGESEIEMYDFGRYFTVTGRHLSGTPSDVRPAQAALDAIHAKYIAKPAPAAPVASTVPPVPAAALDLTDSELLGRMFRAKNGDKIKQLWANDSSDYDNDDSRGDLALCGHLAYWTGKDAARMDGMFRASGRIRPKWDEPRGALTYGQITIATATEGCHDVYHERKTSRTPNIRASGAMYTPMNVPTANSTPARI